tara:strand:- start:109 stop:348 length:240 start_codon:yes stop_codon:yes gene_type:complete
MAKFELKFLDCFFKDDSIRVFLDEEYNEVLDKDVEVIKIQTKINGEYSAILLDKSTAIKFAKTLRTEINKITESEVNNG